ncbi:MAG: DUF4013 domain-containing protein [Chloroflexota bacterium]
MPILPAIFVYGYVVRVTRQAVQGEELKLPAWDDWGALARDGLRAMLVGVAYLLPGGLVFFGGMFVYVATILAIPLWLAAASEPSDLLVSFPLLLMGGMTVLFLSVFVGILLILLGSIPLPLATAHFVKQGEVMAAFRLREWWPLLWQHKLDYLVAWVIVAGVAAVWYIAVMMAYYTVILCWIVPFLAAPVGFYLSLVGAAVFGHTYRESSLITVPNNLKLSE